MHAFFVGVQIDRPPGPRIAILSVPKTTGNGDSVGINGRLSFVTNPNKMRGLQRIYVTYVRIR